VALSWLVAGVVLVPHRVCARGADAAFDGTSTDTAKLATSVNTWTKSSLEESQFHTGSQLFDQEWYFGTYMMAAMAFGQLALEHPEDRPARIASMERCIDALLTPRAKAFDTSQWHEDPIDSLDGPHGHAAYLGYLNLAISLHRSIVKPSKYDALGARITDALARRIEASRTGMLETYPGVMFPVDTASGVGSIGLADRATGSDHPGAVAKYSAAVRAHYLKDGLLVQAAGADGTPWDVARGSGTALGAYFISFADEELSRDLWTAAKRVLYKDVIGFGAVREYAPGAEGNGDVDSGPIVLGLGVSATGFAMAPARIHGDREAWRGIWATVHLFGAPHDDGAARTHVTGGPLGDAILLAMMTAQPSSSRLRESPYRPARAAMSYATQTGAKR
jgi:hypothetical protein